MGGVVSAAQQDVRRSVPQRHHLVGIGLGGDGLGPGQTWRRIPTQVTGCGAKGCVKASGFLADGQPTEVGQLELPSLIDQQVLGLQVSMENFPLMAVGQTSQQLEKKELKTKTRVGGCLEHRTSTKGTTCRSQTHSPLKGSDWGSDWS